MEEIVALAIIGSFVMAEYLECAAVAFFMLIASLIEHRTAVGALKSIESLIRLTPTNAVKLAADGSETEVKAASLVPGDVVLVLPGDNIPGDGVIKNGVSTVNEANITGESLPVEDSTLGQVQSLILQAAQTRPAAVRELGKYAAYYTPVVVMIAAIIFFFTGDLQNSISLLLVACPCAMILAAPTAVVAALSAAARLGVYVKSVAELEVVRRVTAFVFDKTGTITTGNLEVSRGWPPPSSRTRATPWPGPWGPSPARPRWLRPPPKTLPRLPAAASAAPSKAAACWWAARTGSKNKASTSRKPPPPSTPWASWA